VQRRSRLLWLSMTTWRLRLALWGGAMVVAAAAILFAVGAEHAHRLFRRVLAVSPWLPMLLTPLGLALVVAVTRRFFPGSQGSGIPQTIAALAVPQSSSVRNTLGLRVAVGKLGLTLVALGVGASVGREGPTVQIGATIMHGVGRLLRLRSERLTRSLILAGGAAGVAAAFNTPLAGIVFAIEEMGRSFEARASGTILTAVIFAGIASLATLGNYTYFGYASSSLAPGWSWIAVLLCGIAGGTAGGLFAHLLLAASRGLPGRLGERVREHPLLFAAACGILLALIGLASHGASYGTGYGEAKSLLEAGGGTTGLTIAPERFVVLKMLATVVSYASGVPGGIFSPSLATGAGVGALIAPFTPEAPRAAVILLGMAAYFAGVVQAPLTAVVIVMEMTDNHELVVPLMAVALIAHAVSRMINHRPLYRALADAFLAPSRVTGKASARSAK